MRRARTIRELRQRHAKQRKEVLRVKLRHTKPTNPSDIRSKPAVAVPGSSISKIDRQKLIRQSFLNRKKKERNKKILHLPPLKLSFKGFNEYVYTGPKLSILHYIDSLGLGGSQTMMCELVNALNEYYGDFCINYVLSPFKKYNKDLYESYGVTPISVQPRELSDFCKQHSIDIVVHHRIAVSRCIKDHLPSEVKYVLINHTVNRLSMIATFRNCDAYVSVCEYLHKRANWAGNVHPSRKVVILNGVENKYISNLPDTSLSGGFKTGRCHRMSGGKFIESSLKFLGKEVTNKIPDMQHHIIGSIDKTKRDRNKYTSITYHGAILDRNKKMSIIKNLDVYFYETCMEEGASIAVLESLACGVPVICYKYGGNPELIKNDVNGFVVSDRNHSLRIMDSMHNTPGFLQNLKAKTVEDFNSRLHVRHVACKYMQLFEALMK